MFVSLKGVPMNIYSMTGYTGVIQYFKIFFQPLICSQKIQRIGFVFYRKRWYNTYEIFGKED